MAFADAAPTAEQGFPGLVNAVERLPVVASALHVVAHPDDENAGLLVYLDRRTRARTALLTATRGEGGQNLIGPETGNAMGLLRTGETLAADRYYGVDQYFTRAYDFGYSKSADETLQKWDREEILGDFVAVLRTVRPDVVISRFHGTPEDGHGHHQAVGVLIREAFRQAGDPERFPEQIEAGLRPWNPKRLYLEERTRIEYETMDDPRVLIAPEYYDPVLGFTDVGWGILGIRSHRSQGMAARPVEDGRKARRFIVVDSTIPSSKRSVSFFDGIDVSIPGIADRVPSAAGEIDDIGDRLSAIESLAKAAVERMSVSSPDLPLWSVLDGLDRLETLVGKVQRSRMEAADKEELLFYLRWKERDFRDAAHRLAAIHVEAICEDATVIAGQAFQVGVTARNRGRREVEVLSVSIDAPDGWGVTRAKGEPGGLEEARSLAFQFNVSVPEDAPISRMHSYRKDGSDSRHSIRPGMDPFAPYPPPVLTARVSVQILGIALELTEPVRAVLRDRAEGVEYRDVQVVPAVTLDPEPDLIMIPAGNRSQETELRVVVTNHSPGAAAGTVTLSASDTWVVAPPVVPVQFSREDEEAVIMFRVRTPGFESESEGRVTARAVVDGREFSLRQETVSYPHIQTRYLYEPAKTMFRFVDVTVPENLEVGYIRGTQDLVPETIEELPIRLTLLESDDLAFGDLSRFDCIVAGVRAYAERVDLRKHNRRILDYVERGGVFIVQYNKSSDWDPSEFAPYPASYGEITDRITVEDAPVEILAPDHSLFTKPNRITEEDFDGWVQERGLYFWSEWDPAYIPLLSSQDPDEEPKQGGMLIARYGEGLYVYTAYAWFRQLPAGVPGAYRLFANLISLPRTREPAPVTAE